MNDTVCCEVIEVIPDTDKMVCGMKGITRGPDDPPPKPPLGLLSTDDFPLIYKYVPTSRHQSIPVITLLSQYLTGLSDASEHLHSIVSLCIYLFIIVVKSFEALKSVVFVFPPKKQHIRTMVMDLKYI